jgi:hypothetical protein
MPATSNQVQPLAGTIFSEGYVTLTLPGGTPDGVTVGMLQEITVEHKQTKKKLMGPGSKFPQAMGTSERSVTLHAKNSLFDLRQAISAMGGTVAFATSQTTFTSLGNDNPPLLAVTFKTPSDGADMTFKATKVVMDTSTWSLKTHEWFEDDWQCECLPDPASTPTANQVFSVVVSGNQTTS